MPYPDKLQFALDNLIKPQFLESEENKEGPLFQQEKNRYMLTESKESGYSELTVHVPVINLCITEFDHEKPEFPKWGIIVERGNVGMKKAVDHVLLTLTEDGKWKAHLIEMKSGMGTGTFEHVRAKVRANYFSVKALCVYLGITLSDDDFDVYVTYEELRHPSDPALQKAKLGEKPKDVIRSEWNKNRIVIKIPEELELPLFSVKMEREERQGQSPSTALVGSITIR